MSATVSVNGVEKSYRKVRALRDVSFDLVPGRLSALVGHNGAGKTTLIKLMLGLIHADRGSIRVLDENPAAGEFSARRLLGYLPENVAFNAALTGRETLAFYARLKQIKPSTAWALLDRVGLMDAADRRVGTYSKGMRQRLGLAQALLGRPRVLLLDEPTTGLDPALRQTFYEILNELGNDGATVLISSHALNELEDRAEHVLIMNRGLLVAQGTLAELRSISQLPIRVSLDLAHGDTSRRLDERDEHREPRGRVMLVPEKASKMDCCASPPAIPASPTSRSRRRPSTISMPIFSGRMPREEHRHHRRQGNQGRAAQPLGPGDHAAAGGACAVPDIPGQRADRQCRRRRARCGRRQPVQPHDLPAAADRAFDFARCGCRRDGARHHDPAAELSGGPGPGDPRQVLRSRPDPRLRHRHRLWRGGGRSCRHRRLGAGGKLVRFRLHARNLDHARGGVRGDRLSDQQPGARPRHGCRDYRWESGC